MNVTSHVALTPRLCVRTGRRYLKESRCNDAPLDSKIFHPTSLLEPMADSLQNRVFQSRGQQARRVESAARQLDIACVPVCGQLANILRTVPAPEEKVRDVQGVLVLRDRKSHATVFSLARTSVQCSCGSQVRFSKSYTLLLTFCTYMDNGLRSFLKVWDAQRQEVTSCWVLVVTYKEISSLPQLGKLACPPSCFNADVSEFHRILLGCLPCRGAGTCAPRLSPL